MNLYISKTPPKTTSNTWRSIYQSKSSSSSQALAVRENRLSLSIRFIWNLDADTSIRYRCMQSNLSVPFIAQKSKNSPAYRLPSPSFKEHSATILARLWEPSPKYTTCCDSFGDELACKSAPNANSKSPPRPKMPSSNAWRDGRKTREPSSTPPSFKSEKANLPSFSSLYDEWDSFALASMEKKCSSNPSDRFQKLYATRLISSSIALSSNPMHALALLNRFILPSNAAMASATSSASSTIIMFKKTSLV